ncbi:MULTISPECIES: YbdD/YjiX family protein [Rhodococcus]|uniref:Uncharacterized short protein YbdD, DUF466 family n=1 Tax=Rhodococcus maanshanensis TaxID=183556 RepID=A0A1H7MX58_9NOCA|nr:MULTISPECIES: YbdD/YjiX family protein [Rhodococcus]SEL15207.1 Uncharacterized short protein YbdD, DUF466 family [Rhodococcus maanshanensis]
MDRLVRALRGARWWITSVMGDHDYERFAAHHRLAHPGTPVPTEREYWRGRFADSDRNPGARCC